MSDSSSLTDLLFETVPLGLCLVDAGWCIRRVNGAFAELAGDRAGHLVGRNLCEVLDFEPKPVAAKDGLAGTNSCPDCHLRSVIEDTLANGVVHDRIEARISVAREGVRLSLVVLATTARTRIDGAECLLLFLDDVTERYRQDSFARTLSQAIEQSPVSTVITSVDGTIEYVNPQFTKVTGYTAAEAIGQNPRIISSGEIPKSDYTTMWDTIASGSVWTGLFHNKKKSGELYWEEAIISPVKDDEGRIVRYLAVKQDITERKSMAERLSLQAAAMDSALGFIVITDARKQDNPIIYVNAAFYKVTGYAPDEVIGRNCRFLHGKESHQKGLEEIRAGLREERACRSIVRNFRKDGTSFWNEIYIAPVRDDDGQVSHFIGISNDVTDFVTIRDELSNNEHRLRISQEFANIGTWDLDLDSDRFIGSERIAPLFGRTAQTISADHREFMKLIHPEDRRFVDEAIADCLETGTSFQVEHRVVWPDASVHWIGTHGNVTRDESGRPMHLLGIVQDITVRKEAESEIIRSREEALQATRAKSEFLSSMSHELRTPMNAILGFGQLLERDAGLDLSQRDFVGEMMKAGRHLLDLINEVLDLSRIESGKIELTLEPVDLCDLADEGIKLMLPLAQRRGISIEVEAQTQPTVHADRVRLKQALVNLLSNAVKYNREGGRVVVALSASGTVARLEVRDTGPGIPSHRMSELFAPFSRLGRDEGEIEGTGIGLVISKRLVEHMGGTIGAESEEGTGSRFWIELPLTEALVPRPHEAVDTGPARSTK